MTGSEPLDANLLEWLFEPSSPAVQYPAMRDLLDAPVADLSLLRKKAHQNGPKALILSKMDPQGFWDKPGPGYSHKYHSTVWSLLSLAQTGASASEDQRIQTACAYYLDHAFSAGGQFGYAGSPSSTFDCLQGNMCWALTELGCQDERLVSAFDWMARSVTGEGVAPASEKGQPLRYYRYKCAPNFACGANGGFPCAWGAAKVLRAFGSLSPGNRSPVMDQAIQMGIEFLLSVDPAQANYPMGEGQTISQNWWKFSFPVFYISDVLQVIEALISVGMTRDPRMDNAVALIRSKQDQQGRWSLDYSYSGKTWGNFGTLRKPNKWVTLRALRVIKALTQEQQRAPD